MQLSQALDAYVLQLEADGRSIHTSQQAKRHVRLLVAALGDRDVATVKHEDVAKFLASDVVRRRPDGGPRKPTSANGLRSSIKSFFGFCHAAAYSPAHAGRLIRRARTPSPQPKALSEADCAKLVAALETASTLSERRDRALFLVLLRCGLRVGSAVALEVEDVNLDAGELLLRRTKNGDDATVFVPDDVVAILREHIGECTSGPLFVGSSGKRLSRRHVHRRLALWAGRAGLAGVHPHRLRHSLGELVYRRTGDLLVTAAALCHRSVSSAAVYAHADREALRRAIA